MQRPDILSFDSIKSRVVIGLLTGHNTLRRHLHLMGLTKGGYTLVMLPHIVTSYRDSVNGTRACVMYQKLVTR